MQVRRVADKIRTAGLVGLFSVAWHRVFPPRLASFEKCASFVGGKVGLEIGGPSKIFGKGGIIPVYPIAGRIDNCTFSHDTTWEGEIAEGNTFQFDGRAKPGYQYIAEARKLDHIASATYDFIVSSHVLEHVANPLLALREWTRVLKDEGLLVLVVPHKDGTFDHRRAVTSIDHLVQDFDKKVDEGDMT